MYNILQAAQLYKNIHLDQTIDVKTHIGFVSCGQNNLLKMKSLFYQ